MGRRRGVMLGLRDETGVRKAIRIRMDVRELLIYFPWNPISIGFKPIIIERTVSTTNRFLTFIYQYHTALQRNGVPMQLYSG